MNSARGNGAAASHVRAIAVLVSKRIDPVSGAATRSTADAAAVALAQRLNPDPALFTAGEMPASVAREYFALGVTRLTVLMTGDRSPKLDDDAGVADHAVAALAEACADAALVFTGAYGQGALGSGLLPYALAQALARPLVEDVVDVQTDGDAWLVRQALPRGARRRLRISGNAVLVVSDKAPAAMRHSYDAALRGRIETRHVAVGAPALRPLHWPSWRFEPARRQLLPLAARIAQSGHQRMSGATGSTASAASAGGLIVIRDGSVEDKARRLLEHLRSRSLITF